MARKSTRPSWFKMFLSARPMVDAVPDEVAGRVFKAILRYFEDYEIDEIKLNPLGFAVFSSIKPFVDESFSDFNQRVENGQKGGRPAKKPILTSGNQRLVLLTEEEAEAEAEEEEEEEEEAEYSFIHSLESGEAFDPSGEDSTKRSYLGGTLGQGLVMLSEEEMDALLEKLSIEEFNYYCSRVAECERRGKRFTKKTHYQAILDMAMADRKKGRKGKC